MNWIIESPRLLQADMYEFVETIPISIYRTLLYGFHQALCMTGWFID